MPFNPWPEIEALYNIRRTLKMLSELPEGAQPIPTVVYRSKVKLDGTNAGVRVDRDRRVIAQSRTRDLILPDDNYGFAKWVAERLDYFKSVFAQSGAGVGVMTVFGEWCGKGVQAGTAVAEIPRTFAVFAIQYDDTVIVEPDVLREILDVLPFPADRLGPDEVFSGGRNRGLNPPTNMWVIDWYNQSNPDIVVNYADVDAVTTAAKCMDDMVLAVEACDPWVKRLFGVEGIGEGLVFYPRTVKDMEIEAADPTGRTWNEKHRYDGVPREYLTTLMFKAKGMKHRVKAAAKPVEVDATVANSVSEFVATFVTEARCEQGLRVACGQSADMKNMGNFLKWMTADIEKESVADREASNLTMKQVAGDVQRAAREWFSARAKGM